MQGSVKEIEPIPEFRTGIVDLSIIEKNKKHFIKYLLSTDSSPLTNEIKGLLFRFKFDFNYSEKIQNIK
jgi:hypothetical protein